MASIWGELKRRSVVRVAIAYVIVSWLVLQMSDVLIPLLSLPEWVGRLIFLLLVIGFPFSLIMAWAFEVTPDGIKREKSNVQLRSAARHSSRKLDFFIISALSAALIFVVVDQAVLEQTAPGATLSESSRSIAVLPFVNRSAEEENAAFFSNGVHDELLTRLAKISDLKVISRTSVMVYQDTTKNMRQIGTELGVGSVLEGGVQRAGDSVRINVQLIDAQNEENLWSETYDRELNAASIFAIQSEIAREIASTLKATLTPEDQLRLGSVPTDSLEALEAYFKGSDSPESSTQALFRYRQAC